MVAKQVGQHASCLDSAATVDVLGAEHAKEATQVVQLEVPHRLETAGPEAVEVHQVGDAEVAPGIVAKGAWMPPWLGTTLISLWARMSR